MSSKLDTRAIGLDAGLAFAKWLTGAENLHYGIWTGLEVNASNLRAAQEAYTDRLFSFLPDRPLRILDIGGGAGETARRLCDLGHSVEIVVPSEYLAARCRENAPSAAVHEMRFEDFSGTVPFDLCLFSESYQYIPLGIGLAKCRDHLGSDGMVLLADCFRSVEFGAGDHSTVGGGHRINEFRDMVATSDFRVVKEMDITGEVAPSVDLEQALFNVLGHTTTRVGTELKDKRPKTYWLLQRAFRGLVSGRRRQRLDLRLNGKTRTADVFKKNNVYLIALLEQRA